MIVRATLGLHRLEAGGPTLTHPCAGADKTLVFQDGHAALSTRAFTVSFAQQARPGATPDLERQVIMGSWREMPTMPMQYPQVRAPYPYLRAGNPSVQALAGIAVFIPLGSF